MLSCFF
jgi:hypothetical protein